LNVIKNVDIYGDKPSIRTDLWVVIYLTHDKIKKLHDDYISDVILIGDLSEEMNHELENQLNPQGGHASRIFRMTHPSFSVR